MLRLPGNTPLPEAVSALLSKPDCRKAICLPQADGKLFVMDCAFLASQNGVTLLAGLEQERTEAGSGFIRGLWFDRPAEIWLQSGGETLKLAAHVYRCHIAGPSFQLVLHQARARDPEGDLAAVWELIVDSCAQTEEPMPVPQEQHVRGCPEIHFDNPAILR